MRVLTTILCLGMAALVAGCTGSDRWGRVDEEIVELIEEESEDTVDTVTPELRWLASVQNENGSWGKTPYWFDGEGHPGYTALALMAFLDHGETPLSERYGKTVQTAMKWLCEYMLDKDQTATILHHSDSAAAKSQAVAARALCQSYLMTKIPFVRTAMEKAVSELVSAQLPDGGWAPGFDPKGKWDTELSIWCALALTDAQIAGSVNPKLQTALVRSKVFFEKTCRKVDGSIIVAQGAIEKPSDALTFMGKMTSWFVGRDGRDDNLRMVTSIIDGQLPLLRKLEHSDGAWKTVNLTTMESWLLVSDCVLGWESIDKKRSRLWRNTVEKTLLNMRSPKGFWNLSTKDGFEKGDGGGRIAATCFCTMAITWPISYRPTFDKVLHDRFKSDSVKDGIDGDSDGIIIDIGE